MEIIWAIVGAVMLVMVLFVCWVATLFGLPGNWIMVGAALLYRWAVPPVSTLSIGWSVIVALIVLATVAELMEFLAGALGVAKVGGSKLSAVLSLVGSLVGALVGVFVGIPIPIIGPVVTVIVFASLGALGGAMLGENWHGRDLNQSWQVGMAAFWGRALGTLAKTLIGAVMAGVVIAALVLN